MKESIFCPLGEGIGGVCTAPKTSVPDADLVKIGSGWIVSTACRLEERPRELNGDAWRSRMKI